MKAPACSAVIALSVLALSVCSSALGSEMLDILANGYGQNQCPDSTAQVCPAGDFGEIRVSVDDLFGSEGDTIAVYGTIVSGNICFCPGEEPPRYGNLAHDLSVSFEFSGMGGCGRIAFWATSSDGSSTSPTDTIFVSSPDINASCMVNGIDLALFAADYGWTGRRRSDFDCDGETDAIDLTLFARAFGHLCGP